MREARYSRWDQEQARLALLRTTHRLELRPEDEGMQRDYEQALERYEAVLGEVEVLGASAGQA